MDNTWQRLAVATACASIVGLAACGGRNDNNSNTSDSAATAASSITRDSAAGATTPASGTASGAAGTSASGTSTMSITGGDAEILQVLAVVDQGEIQDGRMGQGQARNAQVKSFARSLITDHTKSLQQDRSLAKTANVDLSSVMSSGTSGSAGNTAGRTDSSSKSATSSTSSSASSATPASGVAGQLQTMHSQMASRLQSMKGADFDSAFVNAQVMGHQQVLDLLQRSQNQAQNSGVQQHVAAAIKDVQGHLDHGQKLQQSLAGGGSGKGSDSASKSKTGSDTAKRG